MEIEFDSTKDEANIRTRGLSFERAGDFDFETAVVVVDTRRDYGEVRFRALGWLDDRLCALVFTRVTRGIRVISFRKANRREVKRYEQETKT